MRNSLTRYAIIAKRWAWMVVLGILICGGVTFAISKVMHPIYQASAMLILSVGTSANSAAGNSQAALTLLPTYSQLVENPKVLEPVAAAHRLTIKQLDAMVKVNPQSNTQLIELDIDNGDPRLATQLANEIANSFSTFTNTQLGGAVQIEVLPAVQPIDPIKPKPLEYTLIGALAGLGLSLALIVLFEWLDDRLSDPEEIRSLLGMDPLTIIPALSKKQRSKNAEDTPALAEGCRILCAHLNMIQTTQPFKMLMVTSATSGEGKSTVVANIATFLAMSGKRVLLVDADLRHPVLDQHFQIENRKGFSNAFLEKWTQLQGDLEGQPTEIPSLRVLTAGVLPSNPSELLQSHLAHKLFSHFRNTPRFDYVIFDTPPVLPVADAQILASYIQATVLVADVSKTPRKVLRQAKQILNRAGTRILGVALNKSPWPEYGELQDYLTNIQQRPKADIAISMPNTPSSANSAIEATNTVIMRSAPINRQ